MHLFPALWLAYTSLRCHQQLIRFSRERFTLESRKNQEQDERTEWNKAEFPNESTTPVSSSVLRKISKQPNPRTWPNYISSSINQQSSSRSKDHRASSDLWAGYCSPKRLENTWSPCPPDANSALSWANGSPNKCTDFSKQLRYNNA